MSRVEETARAVASRIGERARSIAALPGEIAIEVPPADLLSVCRDLRDEPGLAFEQLIDLSGIDYLDYGRSEWTTDVRDLDGLQPRRGTRGHRAKRLKWSAVSRSPTSCFPFRGTRASGSAAIARWANRR